MNTNTIKNSLLCCFLGVAYCYTNLAIACSGEGGKAAVISQNQTLSTQNKLQKYLENFQISGALGVSQLSANNGIFLFMPDELDTIRTDRATRSLNFKAGIGYNLFSEKLSQNRFLNNLLVELNFYRFSGSAYGNVYQFGDPASDDIRFTLNIDSSKRIMLDIKPSLFTWRGLSPYLILGADCGWTKSDYQEYDYTDANPRTISSSSTNKNFVIEGGCGLNYAFNKHVGLSLEYLFTRFGKIKNYDATYTSPHHAITYAKVPPEFTNMYTNTALLGFYIKM